MKKIKLLLGTLALLLSMNTFAYKSVLKADAYIIGEVSEASMAVAMKALRQAHKEKPEGEILTVELDSGGGSVFAGYRLMNLIEALQVGGRKVNGIVTGFCASMCFAILQTMNKRMAFPNAILMQHQASGGAPEALREIERHSNIVAARRMGIPVESFRLMCIINLWAASDKALKLKIIDEIVVEKL